MDENKPPEPEPQPAPTVAPQPAPAAVAPGASVSGGPVPFSGPPDTSVPSEEKTQALLMWILTLFIGIISPLIFYFIGKDKPFLFSHAAQGLAFGIVMIVAYVIAFILSFLLIGFLLFPLLWLIGLVVAIMGAIAANSGSRFDVPVTGGFAKSWFKA